MLINQKNSFCWVSKLLVYYSIFQYNLDEKYNTGKVKSIDKYKGKVNQTKCEYFSYCY